VQGSRFSRRTVLAAIDVFECLKHADFDRYIRDLGAEFARSVTGPGVSLRQRLNSVVDLVDDDPGRLIDGRLLSEALVEKAASLFPPAPRQKWKTQGHLTPRMEAFRRMLDLDGFAVSDQAIRRSLPADIGLPDAQDVITQLLSKHRFTTARGHLDQALDAHGRGDWAAANSQIRTFLEASLDEIAVRIDPSAGALKNGNPRCTKLAASDFLSRDLHEWEDNGQGFINGLR